MELNKIKTMVLEALLDEYSLDEAIESVNKAEFLINNNDIHVIWHNGVTNDYKIILVEKLVLIK